MSEMVLPLPEEGNALPQLLTPGELEELMAAFQVVSKLGNGWGEIVVKIKGGRIDSLEIVSSILVRGKPASS